MKIIVMTSQSNVDKSDLDEHFINLLRANKIELSLPDMDHVLFYPEQNLMHFYKLYDSIREKVKKNINNDEDMFVVTYSDTVFYAIRVEIKNKGVKDCMLYQVMNDGTEIHSIISIKGRIDGEWPKEIFDIDDEALIELL